MQNNPIIKSDSEEYGIIFAQTRNEIIDTELYSRFIHSCENGFRKSRFYKDYKASLYEYGLTRDQMMPAITSDMADIEMHHNMITLKFATIMITEHILNRCGRCTTFDVIMELEKAHRKNQLALIMLSKTNHQAYHSDPTAFISLKSCVGNPFEFINTYGDGMTMDISYKILLQLKQEEQYGGNHMINQPHSREQIMSW